MTIAVVESEAADVIKICSAADGSEQRRLPNHGHGIFVISRKSAPVEAPCANAPTIISTLSGF